MTSWLKASHDGRGRHEHLLRNQRPGRSLGDLHHSEGIMDVRTWLSIQWPFSTQANFWELDGATLIKLVRIANNRERFRNVQIR